MSGPNGEKCGDCYFWQQMSNTNQRGICRRYPIPSSEEPKAVTSCGSWCGEFKKLNEGE